MERPKRTVSSGKPAPMICSNRKAPMMPTKLLPSPALRVLWCSWVALLLGTPYFLSDPYVGSALQSTYAYVALGLVVGFALEATVDARLRSRTAKIAIAGLGFAATLALCEVEWAYLLGYLVNGADYIMTEARFNHIVELSREDGLLLVCACGCGLSWSLLRKRALGTDDAPTKQVPGSEGASKALTAVLLLLAIAAGATSRVAVSPFLPYTTPYEGTVHMHLPAALAIVPILFFLLATWLVTKSHGALAPRTYTQLAPKAITAFCLGQLFWNSLTRIYPLASVAKYEELAFDLPLTWVFCAAVVGAYLLGRRILEAYETASDEPLDAAAAMLNVGEVDIAAIPHADKLTEREAASLRGLLSGQTSKDIAETLNLKPSTVRAYLQRAYKKVGVRNAEEAKDAYRRLAEGAAATDEKAPTATTQQGANSQRSLPWDSALHWAKRHKTEIGIALAATALMLIQPPALTDGAWGLGRDVVVFVAWTCIIAAFIGHCTGTPSRSDEKQLPQTGHGQNASLLVRGALTALCLGIVFEEGWRATSVYSSGMICLLFLVPLLIGATILLWRHARDWRTLLAFFWLWTGLATWQGFAVQGFLFATSLAFVLISAFAVKERLVLPNLILLALAGFGIGCLVSLVVVDYASDFVLIGPHLLRPFGGKETVETCYDILGSLIMAAGALTSAIWLHSLSQELRFKNVVTANQQQSTSERTLHYFQSQGLNETQALVALGVLLGKSSSTIAEELHYSPGTVNSARNAAYHALGIHSRHDLLKAASRNIPL